MSVISEGLQLVMSSFGFSILYLFLLFAALLIDVTVPMQAATRP